MFTRFVREADDQQEPDPELFDALWERLRAGLIRELNRRGLRSAPPHFVGVYGLGHWTSETLEELTVDCFQYVFMERLARLRAQLRVKPNVEGLVWLNLRNFLSDRQRQHDPLGYRIYSALRSVVRAAIEEGHLFVIAGDPLIRNDSLLAFSVAPELLDVQGIEERHLAEITQRWADELLPELVTAVAKEQHRVRHRLARRFIALRDQDVAVFKFGQLLTLFRTAVRARWFALFEGQLSMAADEDEDKGRRWVRSMGPERLVEDRDGFEKLVDCVATRLADLEVDDRLRSYLERLWSFLCAWAVDRPDTVAKDELPSARSLAKILDIPRARIPDLFNRLGRLVKACRANQAHASVISG